jgi:hypothetical protein
MATFGKLEKVPATKYGEVNLTYHSMLQAIKETNKNLLVTHRLKEIYKTTMVSKNGDEKMSSEPTGEYRLEGYKATEAIAQVNCVSSYEDGTFRLTIESCNQNMQIAGLDLTDSDITWENLGQLVYPHSKPEEWR